MISINDAWLKHGYYLRTENALEVNVTHVDNHDGMEKRLMCVAVWNNHYDDVIMTMLASQITSLTVVYSIVYSGVNQRKRQSSASLVFVWEIHRDRWISRTNGQSRGKCFHLMTSSCQTTKHDMSRPVLNYWYLSNWWNFKKAYFVSM